MESQDDINFCNGNKKRSCPQSILHHPLDVMHTEHRRCSVVDVLVGHVAPARLLADLHLARAGHVGRLLAAAEAFHRLHLLLGRSARGGTDKKAIHTIDAPRQTTVRTPPGHGVILASEPLAPLRLKVVFVDLVPLRGRCHGYSAPSATHGKSTIVRQPESVADGPHARHTAIQPCRLTRRNDERGPGRELAPEVEVVLHRHSGREDLGPRALPVAAGAAEEALQIRVILAAHAVIEHADERVIQRLGRIEHVLQQDEGGCVGLHAEDLVDVIHRLLRRAIAHRLRVAAAVPRDDAAPRVQCQEGSLHRCKLAGAGAEDVVELAIGAVLALDERQHPLHSRFIHEIKGLVDAAGGLESLNALVALARAEVHHVGVVADGAGSNDQRRIRGRNGHETDVVLGPPLNGAQLADRLKQLPRGAVVVVRGDMRLIKNDQNVAQLTRGGGLGKEALAQLREPTAMVDVLTQAPREALTGLLLPGVVAHARNHEHVIGFDADKRVVPRGEDEADQRRDDTGLARLHLCSQVDPCLLCLEEPGEDLKGRQVLGLERVLPRRGLVSCPPVNGGRPEARQPCREARRRQARLVISDQRVNVHNCVHFCFVV